MKISTVVFQMVSLFFINSVSFTQVHQDWATRNDSVSAAGIAVDKIGNVYVAGSIYRGTSGIFISLTKYDTDGKIQWINEYSGIGDDGAAAIVLDTSGNIFVTGYSSHGSGITNDDIVTIKYNPSGDTLWVRHYSSPGNRVDRAFALAIDTAGNAYVGGYLNSKSYGNVYGNDYITIKYSPDGMELWASKLDFLDASITDMTVDMDGNVYVTGTALDSNAVSHDYITVKYNSSGDSLWLKHYKGLGTDPSNKATAIAIDESGNVYVTGFSTGSTGYYDYATIKYNTDGVEQWVRRFDGPIGEDDKAVGIAVDKNQNVYVTGEVSVQSGVTYLKDFATIKYSSKGDSLWTKYYNGPAYSSDSPVGISIDMENNIYVTGASYDYGANFSTNLDYATIKYNSNGDSLWVKRYDAADLDDTPQAMTVDKSGNVYVTGLSYKSYDSAGSVTIKYSQLLAPAAVNIEKPPVGTGTITSFGNALLTFIGDVNVSDSVTVFYYLAPAVPGELPSGIIWIGNFYWRIVSNGLIFKNGFMRISAQDLVGVTVGGCGACLVWLKRSNSGDPWQNIGGIFDGTFSNGFLTSNIPFGSFSEFAIGSMDSLAASVTDNLEPKEFMLAQNYPNPFNPITKISWQSPTDGWQTLKVYDVLGNEIAKLINEYRSAGKYEIEFNAAKLSSGVYFYRLEAGNFTNTKKLVLLK